MNQDPTSQRFDRDDTLAQASRTHSLRWIALLIGLASTLFVPLVFLSTNNHLETASAVLLALASWTFWALARRGHTRHVPHLMVALVLVVAVTAVLAFGSVRTSAGFLFLAAVVGAGVFLGRRALIASVAFSVVALGLLTAAEAHGYLRTADFGVGLKSWMPQVLTLLVVALIVYHGRNRTERATARLAKELQRRQQVERQLDRNRDHFARIFRTSPIPMVAQSARTGAIVDVNPAFERCYGHTREAVLGRSDEFLWAYPDQRASYASRLFEARHIELHQCTARHADGSTFEVHISSEMGNDRQDKLIITTINDISEHARALEELRRSEERFAKAFNFSPLNMTITRLSDGAFVEVNEAADRVQGVSPRSLAGKTTLQAGVWLTKADRDAFVTKLLRNGRIHNYDTRMRHKDGSLVDARLWAELIEIDGERCVLACSVDVSAEKRREALLLDVARGVSVKTGVDFFPALTRHMAQSLEADMVIMGELHEDDRIRTLSVWKDGAHGRDFSYPMQDTPCGQTLGDAGLCVHAEQLAQRFPNDAALGDGGYEAYVGQSLHDGDGATPIGVLSALWKHPIVLTPELRALMSIFSSRANAELLRLRRDREIRRLNETLEHRVRERTADLRKLNNELDAFAYSVSHDLKSPLRSIDGFTQLLGEQLAGRISPQESALFDRVLAATRRMSDLIADMLALARVSQGPLTLQAVDLSQMVNDILNAELARQPGRQVARRVEKGLMARCDARLARIALENLLGNALKYTRNQPQPLIEFGTNREQPGQPPMLFIRDNGVGFDMAHADNLFKPFQRLHHSSVFEGTGIGLATVRRVVERHGGTIRGRAAPGQGATFIFHLEPVLPPTGTPADTGAEP